MFLWDVIQNLKVCIHFYYKICLERVLKQTWFTEFYIPVQDMILGAARRPFRPLHVVPCTTSWILELDLYGCCNRVPQIGWLKKQIHFLTVLKARIPRSWCSRVCSFRELLQRVCCMSFSRLLVVSGYHHLASTCHPSFCLHLHVVF